MNDYRVKIKQLYREIYNLCISNSVNEEQLLQIFGEAEKEILQNVDSTYIDNGMVMQTTSNDSSLVDKPLFDSQAVAVQSTVPVNNASQTVAPVATSTSSLTIDKPLFDSQAVPVQSTVPVNNVSQTVAPVATSTSSLTIDKPLFSEQAVPVQSTVPVNNVSQTMAPVATSTSSLTIDKPLFSEQAVPVQSTVPVNSNNISQQQVNVIQSGS